MTEDIHEKLADEDEHLSHEVPADLLVLFQVLEWQKAVGGQHVISPHVTRRAETVGLFISRSEWGARPPAGPLPTNITPTQMACHYEGPHMGTPQHSQCPSIVRGIQAYHMDNNGWLDIAYNELVCPHGYVFEGRGPGHRSAANGTNDGNQFAYATCFIGGQGDPFPLVSEHGFWYAAGILGATAWPWYRHSHYFNTDCPGDAVGTWVDNGHKDPTPSGGPVDPQHKPPIPLEPIASDTPWRDGSGQIVGWIQGGANGGIYCWGSAPFYGAPEGQPYWGSTRHIANVSQTSPTSYRVTDTAGEVYNYGTQGMRPMGHRKQSQEQD